jgi:acyl carrier protein
MKEELIKNLAEIIEVETLHLDDEFKNLDEWDSLTAISIIAFVDSRFCKKLTNDMLNNFTTIGDLIKFILE